MASVGFVEVDVVGLTIATLWWGVVGRYSTMLAENLADSTSRPEAVRKLLLPAVASEQVEGGEGDDIEGVAGIERDRAIDADFMLDEGEEQVSSEDCDEMIEWS